MIGGNLVFGIGWWGANQSGSSSGKSCGKILWVNLAGKSCGKFLWEILAGQGGGEKANLRKAVIGWNLAFGIGWWVANQSGSSSGKSCRKILRENLVGNSCGKILQEILLEILWEMLWDIPHTDSKLFLKVIFKIYNSSRSTLFSLVNLKNSFLKPILNRFSHMTHQIKA